MNRRNQIILILSFVAFSWLAMQTVHELGHVLGAVASGGEVKRVVLHPLVFSRTDVSPNPHPLFVVWMGPIIGIALPLVAFLLAKVMRLPGQYLFRFFAGFCLIANGIYIAGGSFQGLADAGDMLRHGSSTWQLILFGLLTAPLGLYLWNGQGSNFGLGKSQGQVNRKATYVSLSLLAILIVVELAFFEKV
jgi:hypothetical protein